MGDYWTSDLAAGVDLEAWSANLWLDNVLGSEGTPSPMAIRLGRGRRARGSCRRSHRQGAQGEARHKRRDNRSVRQARTPRPAIGKRNGQSQTIFESVHNFDDSGFPWRQYFNVLVKRSPQERSNRALKGEEVSC